MTHARRALSEVLALGLANGLLLGVGLTSAHRGPALLIASGAGTFITLTYLLTMRWSRRERPGGTLAGSPGRSPGFAQRR